MIQEPRSAGRARRVRVGARVTFAAAAVAAFCLSSASTASAQAACGQNGGLCGFVWNDTDHDGIQDPLELGLPAAKVTLHDEVAGGEDLTTETDQDGYYLFDVGIGFYRVSVVVPADHDVSPRDQADDAIDSDGEKTDAFDAQGAVISVSKSMVVALEGENPENVDADFGFFLSRNVVEQPGTGTPGYWKNHPEAWPVSEIVLGAPGGVEGVSRFTYTRDQAISWLGRVGKDKTTTMFSSLVSAMLNLKIGNSPTCVAETIVTANQWMSVHPVGSKVSASTAAWAVGEPLHQRMDDYNNGRLYGADGVLCAPHRN